MADEKLWRMEGHRLLQRGEGRGGRERPGRGSGTRTSGFSTEEKGCAGRHHLLDSFLLNAQAPLSGPNVDRLATQLLERDLRLSRSFSCYQRW